jgi:MoaA/NifB/PqqE/SkfB family radical SAM enzyme/SAM-dependent methyltransferase
MTELNASERLVRVERDGLPIYLWPEKPDWFVPNARGDFILTRLLGGRAVSAIADAYGRAFGVAALEAAAQVERFAARLRQPDAPPYPGRDACLSLERLRECWLHITNRCNARCTHCMFCSSPEDAAHLTTEQALDAVRQASALGCELFYFTGGEPFVHDGFRDVCGHILEETAAHVVILTNAIAAPKVLPQIEGWDRERVHFQLSLEGSEVSHDAIRGQGAYRRLVKNAAAILRAGFPASLAMTVHRDNVAEMVKAIRFARSVGVSNVHYMWLFTRGNAGDDLFVSPEEIAPHLAVAAQEAEANGIAIDNLEILKSQVFSIPGTRFDLSNAGWESLAIGPEGRIVPSPALIQREDAVCGHLDDGLESVWRESPRLAELRAASIATTAAYQANPLRFLVGGGDVDHSLSYGDAFTGHDPYVPLYNRTALWLIAREARRFPDRDVPGFRYRMGDWLYECGSEGEGVFFTHSNCVLSLPGKDGHAFARDFYTRAAEEPNQTILNPVQYADADLSFIPEEARVRSYGCGSPIADAGLSPGETVLDLGCGAGIECFLAARAVGPTGRVIGIDMLPPMLKRAESAADQVARNLGYRNTEFHQAFLEDLPLDEGSVDCVISNCVINLSPQKRQVFAEILRVLKPGGRLVIADVASDGEIPIAIQYSEKLRGECLGGAFQQSRLFALLADVGFRQAMIVRRFPYRTVRGHPFQSITYAAVKPTADTGTPIMYRGPFAAVLTDDGRVIERGQMAELPWNETDAIQDSVFTFDPQGNVANAEGMACACFTAPESGDADFAAPDALTCCGPAEADAETEDAPTARHPVDCMVCGEPLVYLDHDEERTCHYCGQRKTANAACAEGHFVCDPCHSQDALEAIERIGRAATETDLVALLKRIRQHQTIPMHGPEHHAIVPAVIVTAYRNAGGQVGEAALSAAIQRGATIAGGSCAFLGVCGAATGVAIGFSILLGANPLQGEKRKLLQHATARVLDHIADLEAARCCQRDCWIGLRVAADLSEELLGVRLPADEPLTCDQLDSNPDCLGADCPLWPAAVPTG